MNDAESDNDLAVQAVRGDRRAFAVLVRRHEAKLVQTARGFGLPESDVEDVVQEAFVAAWQRLADYDPGRPFRPWLFRIAVNKMRDQRRHRRVRRFLFGASGLDSAEAVAGDDPGPEREALGRRQIARVQRVLDGLDRELREALVLTALVGLSHSEAAAALGTSVKGIEGRVLRARRKLAGELEKDSGHAEGTGRPPP